MKRQRTELEKRQRQLTGLEEKLKTRTERLEEKWKERTERLDERETSIRRREDDVRRHSINVQVDASVRMLKYLEENFTCSL